MRESLRQYSCEETLKDGQKFVIRAVHPEDGPKIRQTFSLLDPKTRYMRFLAQKKILTERELARLTGADFENSIVLLATVGEAQNEIVIGGASCFVIDPAPAQRSAEVAFTVEQDFQGRGVGAALMRHLTHDCQGEGPTQTPGGGVMQ